MLATWYSENNCTSEIDRMNDWIRIVIARERAVSEAREGR